MTLPSHPARLLRFLEEARRLAVLAVPIIGSQVASVLMGFLDTVMAGRAGPVEQAVVGLGVAIWIPFFLALMGVVQAVSPIVAHHHGAGDHTAIAEDTRQALWLALLLGLVPLVAMPWAGGLLALFDVAPELVERTVLFLQGTAFGMPAALMFRTLAFYSASIDRPTPAMVLSFVGLAINGVLNYGFIYGHFGLPRLGGAGCGWATGIGMWCTLVLMAGYIAWAKPYRVHAVLGHWSRPRWEAQHRLLRLGLPMGGANLAEVAAFTGVALLIGSLGAATIAAHQSALNFAALMFMLPAGLSAAIAIRVSQALGGGDGSSARFIAWSGVALGVGVALVVSPLIALLRGPIAALYTPDVEVQAMIATLLLFAAVWHAMDAAQVCEAGALRGFRVTLLPMLMMVVAYWLVALPLGSWLGRHGLAAWGVAPLGVYGYWTGLLIGLAGIALALAWLLRRVARQAVRLMPGAQARV